MPPTGMDPKLQSLFTNVAPDAIVKVGSLVNFGYARWIHDPYPLAIVADVAPGNRMRGVNLHYLTFQSIRQLLVGYANNQTFGYQQAIKGNQQWVDAFRTYKWNAIRQIKKLDADFIMKVMELVRSFDPADVEQIRQTVQEQIRRQVNPTASEMTQSGVAQTTPTAPAQGAKGTIPTIPPIGPQ